MKKKLFLFASIIWMYSINAQNSNMEIISSGGNTYQGDNLQIEWTLGELAITELKNSTTRITQGFHQSNYITTSLDKLPPEIGEVKVFPNPTAKWLEISFDFDRDREVQLQLMDMEGHLIWTKKERGQKKIGAKNVMDLPSGLYLLHIIIDQNQFSQSFKIQKID